MCCGLTGKIKGDANLYFGFYRRWRFHIKLIELNRPLVMGIVSNRDRAAEWEMVWPQFAYGCVGESFLSSPPQSGSG